jgi:uncharacterized membrane protein (UPF0127 family)
MTESREGPAEACLTAVNVTKKESDLARRVEWAGTSAQRKRGLLGREALASDEGIYLVPCKGIHTFGMKFAIDVAFLAGDGRVVAVHHSLKPNRISRIALRAEGRLVATGTEVGDLVEFRESAP